MCGLLILDISINCFLFIYSLGRALVHFNRSIRNKCVVSLTFVVVVIVIILILFSYSLFFCLCPKVLIACKVLLCFVVSFFSFFLPTLLLFLSLFSHYSIGHDYNLDVRILFNYVTLDLT